MRASILAALAAVGAVLVVMMLLLVVALDPGSGRAGMVCAPPDGGPGDPVAGFAGPQLQNAQAIVAAGMELGVPQRAQVIAVATAMQESTLKVYANSDVPESLQLPHEAVGSDHDSVGLFQQRAGWGSVADRMDPKASAKLFYEKLLALADWASMPVAAAAQAVQVSAFPDAYAKWESAANEVVGAALGIVCTPGAVGGPDDQLVLDRALSQLGVPYSWAGGNADGPTKGTTGRLGFDCSGLMVYAFAGADVTVPHQSRAIWDAFAPPITARSELHPGDMVFFSDNGGPSGIHHVGLYLGDNRMVHAPRTGDVVKIVEDMWASPHWSGQFIGGVRALGARPTQRV
ncbi:MAG: C40 family peptidase [Dehalococcoidia bacterium]